MTSCQETKSVGLQPAGTFRRQMVGVAGARCRSGYASRRGHGRRVRMRGVHVGTVTVPVSAAAAVDGIASPHPLSTKLGQTKLRFVHPNANAVTVFTSSRNLRTGQ